VIRGLDIFCGAGGSSAGANAAGIEIAAGIDMCPIATETYRANFQHSKVITQRLEDIDLPKLRRRIGNIDILLASPECTNHTCAKGAGPRSEISRATALHVVDYARTFLPRWLVLENVIHMRPWSRYGELKTELESLGYNLAEQVIDASDFGVPQARTRLFIVGDRARKPALVAGKHRGRRRTARSILDPIGTWKTSLLYAKGRAQATLTRAKRGFKKLGEESSFLLVYYGSDGSGGWQALSRPLRTITTIDRFALIEPGKLGHTIRMLQVPELKRAMGFDDSFLLPIGNRRDRIRLLGNGVCPPVMKVVVEALTEGR
jgi:DNA (cytosine-5)-methyltransferase 1